MQRRLTIKSLGLKLLRQTVFLMVVIAVAGPGVKAQPAADNPKAGFFSIQLENDLWGNGADRHYTHGTRILYMPGTQAPEGLKKWLHRVPFFGQQNETFLEFSLGQNLFTPDDIEREQLIEEDQPFAGWLYGSVAALSMIESKANYRSGNSLELTVGVVGPSAGGEDVQRAVHRIVNTRTPRGWDNQLKDEPGVILTYTRMWEYFFRQKSRWSQTSLAPHTVYALGNIYTYMGTGVMLRVGHNLRSDFSPPTISPGFPGTTYFRRSEAFSWYVYTGIEGRAVARNIFLDGNTFRDSHSVDKNLLVADVQVGIAFRFKNIRLALSNVFRSKEFKGQAQISEYGAVNVTVMY